MSLFVLFTSSEKQPGEGVYCLQFSTCLSHWSALITSTLRLRILCFFFILPSFCQPASAVPTARLPAHWSVFPWQDRWYCQRACTRPSPCPRSWCFQSHGGSGAQHWRSLSDNAWQSAHRRPYRWKQARFTRTDQRCRAAQIAIAFQRIGHPHLRKQHTGTLLIRLQHIPINRPVHIGHFTKDFLF